jgi:hypothetical protein
MRRLRIAMLSCLVVAALAGVLSACTNPAGGPDSISGMIGGKGPDHNKD